MALSFVQTAAHFNGTISGTGNASAVFGSAPTNGSTLVAFVTVETTKPLVTNTASGWSLVHTSPGQPTNTVYWKAAGAGESTTQTPARGSAVGNVSGSVVIYEVTGFSGTFSATNIVGIDSIRGTTSSTSSIPASGAGTTTFTGGLLLYAATSSVTTGATVTSAPSGLTNDFNDTSTYPTWFGHATGATGNSPAEAITFSVGATVTGTLVYLTANKALSVSVGDYVNGSPIVQSKVSTGNVASTTNPTVYTSSALNTPPKPGNTLLAILLYTAPYNSTASTPSGWTAGTASGNLDPTGLIGYNYASFTKTVTPTDNGSIAISTGALTGKNVGWTILVVEIYGVSVRTANDIGKLLTSTSVTADGNLTTGISGTTVPNQFVLAITSYLDSTNGSPTMSDAGSAITWGANGAMMALASGSTSAGTTPSFAFHWWDSDNNLQDATTLKMTWTASAYVDALILTSTFIFGTKTVDTGVRTRIFNRPVSDTGSSVSDSVHRVPGKNPTNTQTTSDAISRPATHPRSVSNTQTTSDSIHRIFLRFFTNMNLTSDAVVRAMSTSRAVSNTQAIFDSVTRTVAFFRLPTNTQTTSDAVIKGIVHKLFDTLTTSDAIAKAITRHRFLTNTTTTGDSISRLRHYLRALSNSNALVSDVITPMKVQLRHLADTLTTSDSVVAGHAYSRQLTDADPAISDTISRIRHYLRHPTNTNAFVSDAATATHVLLRMVSNNNPIISDVAIHGHALFRNMANTNLTSDFISTLITYLHPHYLFNITVPTIFGYLGIADLTVVETAIATETVSLNTTT